MSEREIRRSLQELEGIEKSPELFEVEAKAWDHAVFISDYIRMFRSGSLLPTTIYGNPYTTYEEPLRHAELSDRLSALHQQSVSNGLKVVTIAKPRLDELFPGPVVSEEGHQATMFTRGNADMLRQAYFEKFFQMMYGWGFRDIMTIGAQGYLDQVPDQLLLLSFCAPNGTKSFVTQDGYVAVGNDPAPDFDRPLSQRGGIKRGFLRSDREQELKIFEELSSQINFLAEHQQHFTFDDTDLLGYRPQDTQDTGIVSAWTL